MKTRKIIGSIVLLAIISLLYGCGAAHVKTDVQGQNLDSYQNILIHDVRVYSNEHAAKSNGPLQEKLKNWESYSRTLLQNHAKTSKYRLITSLNEANGKTLLLDLDVNVQYGNRALGFGAGKGGVQSTLTIKDSVTGRVKYKANADSDISMGLAGGDIGVILEKNIDALIKQYSES